MRRATHESSSIAEAELCARSNHLYKSSKGEVSLTIIVRSYDLEIAVAIFGVKTRTRPAAGRQDLDAPLRQVKKQLRQASASETEALTLSEDSQKRRFAENAAKLTGFDPDSASAQPPILSCSRHVCMCARNTAGHVQPGRNPQKKYWSMPDFF
jgi:hypothetical protein